MGKEVESGEFRQVNIRLDRMVARGLGHLATAGEYRSISALMEPEWQKVIEKNADLIAATARAQAEQALADAVTVEAIAKQRP